MPSITGSAVNISTGLAEGEWNDSGTTKTRLNGFEAPTVTFGDRELAAKTLRGKTVTPLRNTSMNAEGRWLFPPGKKKGLASQKNEEVDMSTELRVTGEILKKTCGWFRLYMIYIWGMKDYPATLR